jgi:cytochrome P450
MPLDDLTETVGSMLLAGVDTTAYVLGWLLLNIARSPFAQETLAVELKVVLDGSDVTEATIDDLPYLRASLHQVHRPGSGVFHGILQ